MTAQERKTAIAAISDTLISHRRKMMVEADGRRLGRRWSGCMVPVHHRATEVPRLLGRSMREAVAFAARPHLGVGPRMNTLSCWLRVIETATRSRR
jgi:hypothetical protein